jgi:hypothetical protein
MTRIVESGETIFAGQQIDFILTITNNGGTVLN